MRRTRNKYFQYEGEGVGYRTSADFISQRSFTNQTVNCFRCGLRISSGIPEDDCQSSKMRCLCGVKNKINWMMNSNRVSALKYDIQTSFRIKMF